MCSVITFLCSKIDKQLIKLKKKINKKEKHTRLSISTFSLHITTKSSIASLKLSPYSRISTPKVLLLQNCQSSELSMSNNNLRVCAYRAVDVLVREEFPFVFGLSNLRLPPSSGLQGLLCFLYISCLHLNVTKENKNHLHSSCIFIFFQILNVKGGVWW